MRHDIDKGNQSRFSCVTIWIGEQLVLERLRRSRKGGEYRGLVQ